MEDLAILLPSYYTLYTLKEYVCCFIHKRNVFAQRCYTKTFS